MKINMKEVDGKVVVTLDGEMDTTAAVEVEKVLSPLYSEQDKDIILECAKLEYIASSGLRILLSILKGAKASGRSVVMRHVNEDIKDVFKLTHFRIIGKYECVANQLRIHIFCSYLFFSLSTNGLTSRRKYVATEYHSGVLIPSGSRQGR